MAAKEEAVFEVWMLMDWQSGGDMTVADPSRNDDVISKLHNGDL